LLERDCCIKEPALLPSVSAKSPRTPIAVFITTSSLQTSSLQVINQITHTFYTCIHAHTNTYMYKQELQKTDDKEYISEELTCLSPCTCYPRTAGCEVHKESRAEF
jgi:hypothetical protein